MEFQTGDTTCIQGYFPPPYFFPPDFVMKNCMIVGADLPGAGRAGLLCSMSKLPRSPPNHGCCCCWELLQGHLKIFMLFYSRNRIVRTDFSPRRAGNDGRTAAAGADFQLDAVAHAGERIRRRDSRILSWRLWGPGDVTAAVGVFSRVFVYFL